MLMKETKRLTFEVDPESDVPIWVQLRQRLIFLITSGALQPGDQLPTVRGLASEISINYNTVNKAYMSLVSEGYLESTRGRGVFVCGADAREKDESNREISQLVDDFISACRDLGLSLADVQFMVSRRILQLRRAERGEELPGKVADTGDERGDARGAEHAGIEVRGVEFGRGKSRGSGTGA